MSYLINYTPDSNLVNRIAMPSASENSTISYTYDEFERLSRKRISVSLQHRFEEYYEYYTFTKEGKTYTTQLVSKLTLKSYEGIRVLSQEVYEYTYDALGNITTITQNGNIIAKYQYDALNQLICE